MESERTHATLPREKYGRSRHGTCVVGGGRDSVEEPPLPAGPHGGRGVAVARQQVVQEAWVPDGARGAPCPAAARGPPLLAPAPPGLDEASRA